MSIPFEPISAGLGALGSIVGGIFGASSADAQRRDAQQNAENQQLNAFLTNLDAYNFGNAQNQLNYEFAKNSALLSFEIEKAVTLQNWETSKAMENARYIYQSTNNEMEWQAQSAAQQRDFDITRMLQAAEYRSQMRVYEASERTYSENTQLIAASAKQSYEFEKQRLKFERAGIKLDNREARERFAGERRSAVNQAKQIEARYRSELRQAGFSGEELQIRTQQKVQEFTAKQEAGRREASAESAKVAASGKSGATAARMMKDPFNTNDIAIGAMGVELAFFGAERQVEMFKLAEATNLAGALADIDRNQIYNSLNTSARMTNLALEGLNLQEREAIFKSNNALQDTRLQARSQLNEARANRELKPMSPVQLPEPLPIPKSVVPKPFLQPRPMQLAPGLQPLLPQAPMTPPAPRMGAPVSFSSSGAAGQIVSGLFQGAAQFSGALGKYTAPNAGTVQTNPWGL